MICLFFLCVDKIKTILNTNRKFNHAAWTSNTEWSHPSSDSSLANGTRISTAASSKVFFQNIYIYAMECVRKKNSFSRFSDRFNFFFCVRKQFHFPKNEYRTHPLSTKKRDIYSLSCLSPFLKQKDYSTVCVSIPSKKRNFIFRKKNTLSSLYPSRKKFFVFF